MDRVELNRNVYSFEIGNDCSDKFLVIEEELNGKLQLQILKSWEYSMWPYIGERGAMCEVGELFIKGENGNIKLSIEEYIKIYRDTFKNENSIEKIFEDYKIKAIVKRDEKYDEENKFIINKLKQFNLTKIDEKDGVDFYEKDILTVEELDSIPFKVDDKGLYVALKFSKK